MHIGINFLEKCKSHTNKIKNACFAKKKGKKNMAVKWRIIWWTFSQGETQTLPHRLGTHSHKFEDDSPNTLVVITKTGFEQRHRLNQDY